jgi:Amt family ammonium transporter
MIIGVIASVCCYYAIGLVKKLKLDDALDVWGVHGVGGCVGTILLGVFGTASLNASGFNGAIHGGWGFLGKQVVAVLGASLYAFVFSFLMLKLINLITPVKVDPKHAEHGLDEALHGESAYL